MDHMIKLTTLQLELCLSFTRETAQPEGKDAQLKLSTAPTAALQIGT